MSIALVGVSHKSSPLSVRERLAGMGVPAVMERLAGQNLAEAVVLSTCNRFEIYAVGRNGHSTEVLSQLTGRLSDWAGAPIDGYAYRHSDHEAIRHLFSVTAGLDSMVVGETEILGQVKQAYESALSFGRTGKITNVLFQRALYVGKMVRTRTGISMGQSSVASVAVALAERIFGSLKDSRVLILGAGKMAELAVKHLLSDKVPRLYLANRTWEHGVALARQFQEAPASDTIGKGSTTSPMVPAAHMAAGTSAGAARMDGTSRNLRAEAVRWEDFPKLLETADIVISSTGSSEPIITRSMLDAAVPARRGRSLFIIDIAMPRDVEESVHEMDGVYLYTLENLSDIIEENVSRRQAEITAAQTLVHGKASEFWTWLSASSSGVQAGLRHSMRCAPGT